MISRYSYDGLTWVDLESPTKEEVLHILDEFSLPQLVGEEILTSTLRSKVDLYESFIYLIFHFPTVNRRTGQPIEQEIDFIIGKNFLITVRYELVDPVHEFSKVFEANSIMNRATLARHAGLVFMEMMKQFYKQSLHDLEEMTLKLRSVENRIFKGQEEHIVKELSLMSRRLLDFKQAIRFHQEILQSYETASKRFFGDDYGYYASLIMSEFNKVNSMLESNRDALIELQRTNDSLLTTKSNSIMRTFTAMSFITFPLMLVAGIFGMNTPNDIMLIRSQEDLLLVIGGMAILAVLLFLIFKWRKLM